jgi:hypothetical protein
MNTNELLASSGISVGTLVVYKVITKLYKKYMINSKCVHPTNDSTDIIIHIQERLETKEKESLETKEKEIA